MQSWLPRQSLLLGRYSLLSYIIQILYLQIFITAALLQGLRVVRDMVMMVTDDDIDMEDDSDRRLCKREKRSHSTRIQKGIRLKSKARDEGMTEKHLTGRLRLEGRSVCVKEAVDR